MKKLVASFVSIVILLTLSMPVYAVSFSAASNDQVLLNFGYLPEIVATMDNSAKSDLANAIRSDPDSVQLSQSVYSFDETSTIRTLVTSTNDQLLKKGYTEAEISLIRKTLDELSSSTDEQLRAKYNRSELDVRSLRIALDPNLPMPRSISPSTLSYSSTSYAISIGKPVAYRTVVSFTWNSFPWIHFDDKVAIGWGGNLATTNPSSSGTYLNTDTGAYQYYSAAHSENPINAGYTFTYARQRGDKILKSGTVQLDLYQNVRQGIASKIITIYGHQTVAGTIGIGITASGPNVSFSLKLGWDFSEQKNHKITY